MKKRWPMFVIGSLFIAVLTLAMLIWNGMILRNNPSEAKYPSKTA